MTYQRERIKTQRNLRNDGRTTVTIKLIGYTEAELLDLGHWLAGHGNAGMDRQEPGASLALDVGAYLTRAVTEPKP